MCSPHSSLTCAPINVLKKTLTCQQVSDLTWKMGWEDDSAVNILLQNGENQSSEFRYLEAMQIAGEHAGLPVIPLFEDRDTE